MTVSYPASSRASSANGHPANGTQSPRVPYRRELLTEASRSPLDPIYLVEDESDADALIAIGLIAICPAKDSGHWIAEDWKEYLSGRMLAVVGKSDDQGQDESKTLSRGLAVFAAIVKVIELGGYEGQAKLSQWVAGLDPAVASSALRALFDGGVPVAAVDGAPRARVVPNEADDDPHRLGRIYLDRVKHSASLTLRFWREDWYRWDGTAYRIAPDKEVRGELTGSIKAEFDRLNLISLRSHDNGKAPPKVRAVTTKLVGNVMNALSDMALLRARDCPSVPGWLTPNPRWPASEILPTRNSVVHLPSLVEGRPSTMEPTPAFFCPYSLDFDFNPNAPEPTEWLSFLGKLWGDDRESIELLQEWFGYLLTADTSQQKMLMVIGPKRSGKGTIARVLRALIGPENVGSPTLSKMSTNFGLAPLIGKTAAVIADARLSGRADQAVIVERLLSITGEDSQSIDRKHREDWEGKLSTRFLLISNELPKLSDASAALPSRMLVLRLTKSFYGREDMGLLNRLLPELPGILLWAVEGWSRLKKRGRFEQPKTGRELADEMESLASPINVFLRDCCKIDDASECETPELYKAWRQWCEENGRDNPGNEQNFGRNLRTAVPRLETKRTRRGARMIRLYVGVEPINTVPF